MQTGAIDCPNCNTTSRGAIKFCSQCGTFLGRHCPCCEATLPAGAEFCNACGFTLDEPGEAQVRRGAPRRVGGERKIVSILFADMVGSTQVLADIGAEQGRWLIEAVVDRMKAAVEAFGGIVNQVSGDGIMALFGAPRALEDHALRACHAALRMQRTIGAEMFPHAPGQRVAIRVGVHSGETVVAERGRGFDHQYTAFGVAAHTAARVQGVAEPGQALISAATAAQVDRLATLRPIGPAALKGIPEPVEIFELLDASQSTSGHQRGIGAPFIGRGAVMAELDALAGDARAGHGRTALVLGEAGSGKSRLCRELLRGRASAFRVVQTAGHPFLSPPPYAAAAECVRACLPPGTATPDEIRAWLSTLGADAPPHASALIPLLSSHPAADPGWAMLSFRERQARITAAIVHVLRATALRQPLLMFVDDLQWIDASSAEVIAALARQVADVPLLLLANARAGDVHPGLRDAATAVVTLDTFTEAETGRFLDEVMAPAPVGEALRRRLFRLTGGNAFFLEEVVKVLRGDPSVAAAADGTAGREAIAEREIPGTVQDLLAMRIDHLPAPAKAALQAAAVLGVELDTEHLADMLGLAPHMMDGITARLREAAFLLPVDDAPAVEGSSRLAFRHVLAREAAYAGLLQEDRHTLHARALDVLEPAAGQEPSLLAFHAMRCARWSKAHRYSEAAGRVSIDRSAPREAMQFFGDALNSLGRLDANPSTRRAELDLRFLIRNTLFSLGRAREIGEHLNAARTLADLLGDRASEARALCLTAHHAWQMGRWTDALEAARTAHGLAEAIGDLGLQVSSNFFTGLAALALGQVKDGAEVLARNIELLPGDLALERFGFVSICSVVSGSFLAVCLTELGRFEDAARAAARAHATAQQAGNPFDRIQAELAVAGVALMQGEANRHIDLLEAALARARAAAVAVLLPRTTSALAFAYALAGRLDEAAMLVGEREEQSGEAVRAMSLLSSAEALLLCGDADAACHRAEALIDFAATTGQAGAEAWGHLILGTGQLASGNPEEAAAHAAAAHTTAVRLHMSPLAARAALLAAVAGPGRIDAEAPAVHAAVAQCEQAGMSAWVPRLLALRPTAPVAIAASQGAA